MQRVLEALEDAPVDVFVVWIPAIASDRYEETERAMKLIPDERARHYWDGSQALGDALSPVLGLHAKMAWDVYLIYGKDASWSASPPEPLFWMHQLPREDAEKKLDETRLKELVLEVAGSGS